MSLSWPEALPSLHAPGSVKQYLLASCRLAQSVPPTPPVPVRPLQRQAALSVPPQLPVRYCPAPHVESAHVAHRPCWVTLSASARYWPSAHVGRARHLKPSTEPAHVPTR